MKITFKKFLSKSIIFPIVLSVLALIFTSFMVPQKASAITPKTALVYGDSLTWESIWEINAQAKLKTGWKFTTHSYPGTGICLWNTWLAADLAQYQPSVVAITSAGNNYSPSFPCMVDSSGNPLYIGSDAYFAKWQADLDEFFATVTASGAKVVFFKAPPMKDPVRNAAVITQTTIAQNLALKYHGVSIAANIRNALSKSGKYTDYKPCLATETAAMGCVGGQIPIRTITGIQAGLHFCPDGLPTTSPFLCLGYSGGEYRFGKTLVNVTVKPPAPVVL